MRDMEQIKARISTVSPRGDAITMQHMRRLIARVEQLESALDRIANTPTYGNDGKEIGHISEVIARVALEEEQS